MTETKPIQAITEDQAAAITTAFAALAVEASEGLRRFGEAMSVMASSLAADVRAHRQP